MRSAPICAVICEKSRPTQGSTSCKRESPANDIRQSARAAATIAAVLTPPDPLSAAQTTYVDSEYAEAIELARDSRAAEPTRAWRITGAAACRLHDPKLADKAFRRVRDPASRQYLIYACQRSRMSRLGRHFRVNDQE